MEKLIPLLKSNKNMNDKTRFKITYKTVKGFSKFPWAKPAIKKHLFSQIKSNYLIIPPQDWQIALYLKTENFKGSNNIGVWRDSSQKY